MLHRPGLVLKAIVLMFYIMAAHAADPVLPQIPTAEQLKNAPLSKMPTDEELKNAPLSTMPTDEQLKNVQIPKIPDTTNMKGLDYKQPIINLPGLDALIQSQPSTKINPEDIMNAYKDMQAQPQLLSQGHIYIFVSFSMPKTSLSNLVRDAERVGATLVLRGFHENSMRKTALKVQETIGNHRVGWQIDPPAFSRYKVEVVPAFVLVKAGTVQVPCKDAKCEKPPVEYGMVVGDVSIDYAVESISKQKPSMDAEASYFLGKLRN